MIFPLVAGAIVNSLAFGIFRRSFQTHRLPESPPGIEIHRLPESPPGIEIPVS